MEPKRRWFRRGNLVLGIDVDRPDYDELVAERFERGFVEVTVRPKRSALAGFVGAVVAGLVVSIVVGALVWAAVAVWRAAW